MHDEATHLGPGVPGEEFQTSTLPRLGLPEVARHQVARHPHSPHSQRLGVPVTHTPSDWRQLELPSPNGGCLATRRVGVWNPGEWVSGIPESGGEWVSGIALESRVAAILERQVADQGVLSAEADAGQEVRVMVSRLW
jgi:hypothetical protein